MARYDLHGKSALITGGARGIGLATARSLIARGASVTIVDVHAEQAAAAAAQLHDTRAVAVGGDVTDRGAMQRAVAVAVERFGGLDVVVANAGIAARVATFRAYHTETFERVLDVNLMGVYRTVDAALPEIVRRQGHVVVISSIYAFMNGIGEVPYAMSKAAVEQLGRALRVELVQHGASASVAHFGFIDTEMVHQGLDRDPLVKDMMSSLPKPLRKRLPPSAAGEAIARGIERRQAASSSRAAGPRWRCCAASSARSPTRAWSATSGCRRICASSTRAPARTSRRARRAGPATRSAGRGAQADQRVRPGPLSRCACRPGACARGARAAP